MTPQLRRRERRASFAPMITGAAIAALLFPAAASGQQSPSPELRKKRSIAAAQHEIVVLHIERKEYGRAVDEAAKIFRMDWPADQEPLLLKDALFLANKLLHVGQAGFALKLLENNEKTFRSTESRVAILKEKGYLHRELSDTAKALECFREAQRLEQGGAKPP